MEELIKMLARLGDWVNSGSRVTVDKAVKNLAVSYRNRIRSGLNADNSRMEPLKDATLEAPIRLWREHKSGSKPPRSSYGDTPLVATGRTVDSIEGRKVGPDKWEIGPKDIESAKILNSNAKPSHSGYPFAGDTPKAVRDPLTVEDPQLDLIEDQIVQDLERVLGV